MFIRKAELADAVGIAKVYVDGWRTTYKGIVPDTICRMKVASRCG